MSNNVEHSNRNTTSKASFLQEFHFSPKTTTHPLTKQTKSRKITAIFNKSSNARR
jgi:hypothetical protein